jgi:hypothetical protein
MLMAGPQVLLRLTTTCLAVYSAELQGSGARHKAACRQSLREEGAVHAVDDPRCNGIYRCHQK